MKFSADPKIFEKSSKLPSLFKSIAWEDEDALSFKLKKIIYQAISQIIREKVKFSEVQLEHPANEAFGDYSTNIALVLASKLGQKKGNFLENIDWLVKNVTKENFENYSQPLPVGKLSKEVKEAIKAESEFVYLKPRIYAKINNWWKRTKGHPEVSSVFFFLPFICHFPLAVYADKSRKNGYLLAFDVGHFGLLIVEVLEEEGTNEIVTMFFTRLSRVTRQRVILKTKKSFLGRRRISSLLASRVKLGIAGAGLSSLQESQLFYNKLGRVCQEKLLSYEIKISPRGIAGEIADYLNNLIKQSQTLSSSSHILSLFLIPTMLQKAEAAGPGFLNLWLRKDYLITLSRLLQEKNGTKTTPLYGRKLMVEFTDPNPFKEFHIGHLYSKSVGESLSRLMEYCGATVARANYQGDVGMHVAKSIWGIVKKMENEKLEIKDLEERGLKKKIEFLGEAYALGNAAYEEKAKEEMEDINYLVFVAAQQYLAKKEGWQPQVNYQQYIHGRKKLARVGELFEKGRRWSLDYFETLYRRLGTRFDYYYFESIVGEYGAKLVKEHLKDGIFEESEGAIVYRGEKYGLHTRVFINALGLPTYEAKELGLAPAKYKDFPYDLSLIVTGNEINEYFQVLLSALEKIKPELAKKTWHIGHGMVRLAEGKMSSRTGKVLTGEWLIDQAKLKIFEILEESKTKHTKEEKNIIAEKAAIAAVKYSLLKVSLPSDITFDLAKSVSLEGDSGPYLMYTYARCKSVVRKSKREDSITGDATGGPPARAQSRLNRDEHLMGVRSGRTCEDLKIEFNPEEISLLRTLYRFPEVVIEAARTFSPNIICSFLFDLAQKYNLFYDKHSILHLGKDELATTNFRLFLTFATATIVKQGLYLLGIETVERM